MTLTGQFAAAVLLLSTSSLWMITDWIPFFVTDPTKVLLPSMRDIRQQDGAASTQALQPMHFSR
jgi:hypothetical protein